MASGYALFDGTDESKIETPDHPSLDISGDIDIRVLVALDDWITEVPDSRLVRKTHDDDPLGSAFDAKVVADGPLYLQWGSTAEERGNSTVNPTVSNGEHLWLRMTLATAGATLRFYTSSQPVDIDPDAVVWSQLGDAVVLAPGTIPTNDYPVILGGRLWGKMYYLEIRNGINGTIVADPDFRDADQKTGDSPTTFTDTTGKVWTFDTAIWVPPSGGGRRKTRPPRNPRRYQV